MKTAVKLFGVFTGRKCIIATALFMLVLLLDVNPALAADPMDTWKLTYCGSNTEERKMTSAAYGGNTVTAVGEMDKILYSTNGGKNWTAREYSGSRYLQDIGYGANKFAAVGRYDTTAVSNGGVSWSMSFGEPGTTHYDSSYGGITTYTYGTADYNFTDIAYGNGKFVAVGFVDLRYKFDNYLGRGVIKTSTDGVNWQYQVDSNDKNVHSLYDLTFINGKFVAVLRDSFSKIIATSSNGVDWELRSLRPAGYSSDISQIAYGNGVYMAVFFNGSVMTSPDCENWTEVGVISSSGYFRPSDLIFTKGIFVVTGNKTFYSVDGKQWTEAATISGPGYSLRALAPVNDIVLGLGDYLSVYQSEPLVPPAAPLMLSADADANTVDVFWRDISDSETGYRVFRSSILVG